ncbi:hypothetical protein R1flu_026640 [Riccia fluitans]|uniref:Uncharacterized protein n=1 Tax=Riccia fluitans TaxID=41844 RepID=A0ABD1XGI4_9MARC
MGSERGIDAENTRSKPSNHDGTDLQWAAQTITNHAVQCAKCGKYRYIPDKTHYEVIRENIHQLPWVCTSALPWNPLASCDIPDEIAENPKFLLAVDRPGIPATPPGWERSIHVRAGPNPPWSSCNVYFFAPAGQLPKTDRRMRTFKDISM